MAGQLLGLVFSQVHDSALALVSPTGEVQLAVAEERLSRYKKDGRWPERALSLVDLDQVSLICLPYLPSDARVEVTDDPRFAEIAFRRSQPFPDGKLFYPYSDEWIRSYESLGKPLHHVDHHDAHAAAGYYWSDREDVLVLTSDSGACNCPWFMGAYHGRDGRLEPLVRMPVAYYHPVCDGYSDITAVLGFKPMRHEGKITGLAGHGRSDARCQEAVESVIQEIREAQIPLYQWINVGDEEVPASLEVNAGAVDYYRGRLADWSREDIAAAAQNFLEERLLRFARLARESCDATHVALVGGAFSNVLLNQKVFELGFESVFVCPPMTDDGLAVGAVFHYLGEKGKLRPKRVKHMFLGPVHQDGEARQALEKMGVPAKPSESVHSDIAGLLAQGKVVARWHGRMEFGPRALGNRTVYYRADDPTCQDWLNQKLQRTEFMPFAPCTLASQAADLYEGLDGCDYTAEFMTITCNCTDKMKQQSPAVVHVDGTARPQLVTEEANPDMFAVLREYFELTGVPTLINTSFNIHEEPIVCSAEDAIHAFLESGIDYLFVDDYQLCFEELRDLARDESARVLERRELALRQQAEWARILGERLLELRKAHDYAEEHITHVERELERVQRRNEELDMTVKNLREQVTKLEGHLTNMRKSRVWRSLEKYLVMRARRRGEDVEAF